MKLFFTVFIQLIHVFFYIRLKDNEKIFYLIHYFRERLIFIMKLASFSLHEMIWNSAINQHFSWKYSIMKKKPCTKVIGELIQRNSCILMFWFGVLLLPHIHHEAVKKQKANFMYFKCSVLFILMINLFQTNLVRRVWFFSCRWTFH